MRFAPVGDKELLFLQAVEGLGLKYSQQHIKTMNPIIYEDNPLTEMLFNMGMLRKGMIPTLKDIFDKKVSNMFLDLNETLVTMQKTINFNKHMVRQMINIFKAC